ncbi:FMN-binding protein [Microbacterium sp. SYP-A9085]|uniref:FMN-binding protein n=1 Tax=Microbacterium sp. SYP-A9085 TaxID=2664454 RepID=UPI00129B4292|nr:FMN-binding protein [Microbacterium sp. SYP-A9085]MRH27818.1 FMN-binding protein [Microbacterium sp. SYP-A9085]
MKKIVYGALATLSGLVLLFSYRTSLGENLVPTPTTGAPGGAATAPTGPTDATTGGASSAGAGGSSTAGTSLQDGTYTGGVAQTPYGAVQVRVTVSGGRLTAVDVPQYPNGTPRDAQINQYAVPQLVSETTSAQNAQIDMVSGATFTSEGYLQSLQSALDQAAP